MVGTVSRRAVPVAIARLVVGQQPLERREQVRVRTGAHLEDRHARGRVWDEDREQSIAGPVLGGLRDERGAGRGQVDQAGDMAGVDRELAGPYGKMLRSASRIRLRPPLPGTDS